MQQISNPVTTAPSKWVEGNSNSELNRRNPLWSFKVPRFYGHVLSYDLHYGSPFTYLQERVGHQPPVKSHLSQARETAA